MLNSETGPVDQEEPMSETGRSRLLSVALCVAGVLGLLTAGIGAVQRLAADPSVWSDVLMSYGYAVVFAAVVVLSYRSKWKVDPDWVGWIFVGIVVLVTANSWRILFSAPGSHRVFDIDPSSLLPNLLGSMALSAGLMRLRLRGAEAPAASGSDAASS